MPKKAEPTTTEVLHDLDQALKNMPEGAAITLLRSDDCIITYAETDRGDDFARHHGTSIEDGLRRLHGLNTAVERVFKEDGK